MSTLFFPPPLLLPAQRAPPLSCSAAAREAKERKGAAGEPQGASTRQETRCVWRACGAFVGSSFNRRSLEASPKLRSPKECCSESKTWTPSPIGARNTVSTWRLFVFLRQNARGQCSTAHSLRRRHCIAAHSLPRPSQTCWSTNSKWTPFALPSRRLKS